MNTERYTRRQFLKTSATVAAAVATQQAGLLHASPFGLPLGIQLYSVREFLPKDYLGTLKKVAALGFKEVEAAGFYDHTPAEVKAAMQEAGLNLVSAHYSSAALYPNVDKTIDYCHELGLQYLICASPSPRVPPQAKGHPLSIDDWRWNAEQFNIIGAKVKAAGMTFGYHNHTPEFGAIDGVVPYDVLMSHTDPDKVVFEMDTGWVVVGGGDPLKYLHRYANRIVMLHVKDFDGDKLSPTGQRPTPKSLGRGVIPIHKIIAAAHQAKIKHCFVEQEAWDMEPWASLKTDEEFMAAIKS